MASPTGVTRATTGWQGEFAEDPSAIHVDIYLNGIRYPGEAVFTEHWDSRWGVAPGTEAMFRVVFTGTPGHIPSGDLGDDRIVVVAPCEAISADIRPAAREAVALRETRAGYSVSGDPELSQLAEALKLREGELASQIAASMSKRWSRGDVVHRVEAPDLAALLPTLEKSGPDAWIEALGAWVIRNGSETELPRSDTPMTPELISDVYDLVSGRSPNAEPRVMDAATELGFRKRASPQVTRFSTGLERLLESGPADETSEALSVSGPVVRSFVVSTLRMPLDLGALYLVDYVRRRNAEAALVPVTDEGRPESINRDTLPDTTWDPGMLQRLNEVRSTPESGWSAALPYMTSVWPAVSASQSPAGSDQEARHDEDRASEFMVELGAQQAMVALTASVIRKLERLLGLDSGWEIDRLASVMSAASWSEFTDRAREVYGSARGLRLALARERNARTLATRVGEIEGAINYLDAAEFGVQHRPLELEARALRERFSADLLNEFDSTWPALSSAFEMWRTDYRRAYTSAHTERRARDEELQQKMARAVVQVAAVEGFGHIPEFGPPGDGDLTRRYDELALGIEPCERLEHDIPLINQPTCEECGITLRSPMERPEIDEYLFELESVLRSYNRRLSSVAVREALAGNQPERLTRLLRLRDASDLSPLSGHLGADVIDFLREFLAGSESQD